MLLTTMNDLSNFSELYDTYAPAVYGSILEIVKNKSTAEKILEEVFVTIWCKRTENTIHISYFISLLNEARNISNAQLKSSEYLMSTLVN